jgi:hypothetical protein
VAVYVPEATHLVVVWVTVREVPKKHSQAEDSKDASSGGTQEGVGIGKVGRGIVGIEIVGREIVGSCLFSKPGTRGVGVG